MTLTGSLLMIVLSCLQFATVIPELLKPQGLINTSYCEYSESPGDFHKVVF